MMRWVHPRATLFGMPIVATNRVKRGKLYHFEGYVLVNMLDEMELTAWFQGTAHRVRSGMFG